MVRLDRGGTEFLIAVTTRLFELGAQEAFSPALYGASTKVWRRSGFEDHAHLDVMERPLNGEIPQIDTALVEDEPDPDWDEILEVDRAAFEGFWGMSRMGLDEAHRTNRSARLLVVRASDQAAGYAIVGVQWGVVYLHRIAVHPAHTGQGLGAALLTASIEWGIRTGARAMVLNVRPDNHRAKRLYGRHGFNDTGTALEVLHRRPQT